MVALILVPVITDVVQNVETISEINLFDALIVVSTTDVVTVGIAIVVEKEVEITVVVPDCVTVKVIDETAEDVSVVNEFTSLVVETVSIELVATSLVVELDGNEVTDEVGVTVIVEVCPETVTVTTTELDV